MANRKITPTKSKDKSPAELRRQLARDITAVLANPECPTALYNDIASGILGIFNSIPTYRLDTSEAYTLSLLEEYAAAREKGEVR